MKAKEFIRILTKLHTLNQDADVYFIYDTSDGVRFQEPKEIDINYKQSLVGNKLVIDDTKIMIDMVGNGEQDV